MKINLNISLLVLVSVFYSCDKTITLTIDDAKAKKINFSCGSVSIKSIKSFGPGYTISNQFHLTNELKLNFDSLIIEHKERKLSYEVSDETGKKLSDRILSISNDKFINFHINQNFDTGDTLVVSVKDFIICKGSSVYNQKICIILNDYP